MDTTRKRLIVNFTVILFLILLINVTSTAADVYDIKEVTPSDPGGDCDLIGLWNTATSTCTLTTDISYSGSIQSIQIDSDGVTLNGNDHWLTGTGVLLYGRTDVTV